VLLKTNTTIAKRKQGPITPNAHPWSGMKTGAELSNEDVTSGDDLAITALYTTILRVGIPAIPGAALAFFMCHCLLLCASAANATLRESILRDGLNTEGRLCRAKANALAVTTSPPIFVNVYFGTTFVGNYFRHDACPINKRNTKRGGITADKEDIFEIDCTANLCLNVTDRDGVAFADPILSTACLNHRKHGEFS